jgi:hypothetical protein
VVIDGSAKAMTMEITATVMTNSSKVKPEFFFMLVS